MSTYGPLFDNKGGEICTIQHSTITADARGSDGKQLRDQGLALVSEHNENWMEKCTDEVVGYWASVLHDDFDFTGEDLRLWCETTVGNPTHPNAWGALINTLIKRKIIVPTGEHRKMKDSRSHARSTPVYKAV